MRYSETGAIVGYGLLAGVWAFAEAQEASRIARAVHGAFLTGDLLKQFS
jgi:hypothetical protein